MKSAHNFQHNQPVVWFDTDKSKSNQHCLYCGRHVGSGSEIASNREHLIGRNFVPTGSFGDGKAFNFIFRACQMCNDLKAKRERHVSSVSMFNSMEQMENPRDIELAQRKASKDYHPDKSGTLIKDCSERHNIKGKAMNAEMSFTLNSPPQLSEADVVGLAQFHIQGLFSLITSENPLTTSGTKFLPIENIWVHESYVYTDWGNPRLREIATRASKIEQILLIETANANFKGTFSRDNESKEWFWALEWNRYLRIVGGIGDPENEPFLFNNLPSHNWVKVGKGLSIRKEEPVHHKNDTLFELRNIF